MSSREEITAHTAEAVAWMTRLGILSNDHITEMFITLKTVIANPGLVPSCPSRISIRKGLSECGWQSGSGRDASLEWKKFNNEGCLEYFLLIQNHIDPLTAYDKEYGFRHSQSKAYYDALRTCFSQTETWNDSAQLSVVLLTSIGCQNSWVSCLKELCGVEKQYVAPSQKLEFYKNLQAFFSGGLGILCCCHLKLVLLSQGEDGCPDPRLEANLMLPSRAPRKRKAAAEPDGDVGEYPENVARQSFANPVVREETVHSGDLASASASTRAPADVDPRSEGSIGISFWLR